MRRGSFRIGTSGYQYDHWRGSFYPEELAKKRWFERYAREFDTVEINNTFYRLPRPEVFAAWRAAAPPGFLFAVKMSRFATHMKHLRDAEQTIGRLLQGARELGPTLGPILVQLPPRWRADPGRLDEFLAAAPKEHRWAVELRHDSWLGDEVFAVLRAHDAALVVHDMLPSHPRELTAGWTYLRFHGGRSERYAGSYSGPALRGQARWIDAQLRAGRDVYAYFNNDLQGHAFRDAGRLRAMVERAREAGSAQANAAG